MSDKASSPALDPAPAVRLLRARPWLPWSLICCGLLLFVALALGLVAFIQYFKLQNELGLPVLAIAGVVALLGALALVAVSFSLMGLSDRTQALGLPSGSVRAVIALSLIVLFAILTVFLFSSLHHGGTVETEACLTADDFARARASLSSRELLLGRQMTDTEARACFGAAPRPDTGAERYLLRLRTLTNPAGEDFAKQLLVLIGTLVTSVASFYFGARVVSEAHDMAAGTNLAPVLQGVSPPATPPGPAVRLQLMGSSLGQVSQAQMSNGPDRIAAVSVTSNEGRVEATFALPPTTAPGPWDLSVTDHAGRVAQLRAALTVTPAPPPS